MNLSCERSLLQWNINHVANVPFTQEPTKSTSIVVVTKAEPADSVVGFGGSLPPKLIDTGFGFGGAPQPTYAGLGFRKTELKPANTGFGFGNHAPKPANTGFGFGGS
jgi:hypothetical protein